MTTRDSQRQHLGAAGNNTRRTQGGISRDKGGATVIGTGISFTGASTIADSGNGFGAIQVGDMIEVRGSPLNSREWRVNTAAAGSITVRPQMITSESAGAVITVTRKG
jgi:hypothetical protein